jgi:acetylornithine deacetylase/succinyl-diaminopimelate desuccinylase-like protein
MTDPASQGILISMKTTLQHLVQHLPLDSDIAALAAWVVEESVIIQQIPAPTFHEEARAAYVAEQFHGFGLEDVEIDEQKNVYGRLKGQSSSTALMLIAHTDTVFPAQADLTLRRTPEGIIYGPGLGDNSIGVAGLLGLVRYLRDISLKPACDLWCVATSCEEGLGDLKGIRAAYDRLKHQVSAVINLEGMALGHVYHGGIAVHRQKIITQTEGGHSWLHYGRASAVHALMQLGAALISNLKPPTAPRTTYNIGVVEGGQSVNSIAAEAAMWLDLRSEDQHELDRLKAQVASILKDATPADVSVKVEVVGDRPAGLLHPGHHLVQGALYALEIVGLQGSLEIGSTDANIPLHYGCPAVTIGITRGGNAHRADEFIEVPPISQGMKQFILLTLAAAQSYSE